MTDTTDTVQAEATGAETVNIEYGGNTYTVPAAIDDYDGDVVDAMDDQKLSHAIRGILGDDQWERFKASKPKVSAYGEFIEAWTKAIGLDSLGN